MRRYTISYRSAESGDKDGWEVVGGAPSAAAVLDELGWWQGPRLTHGDLVFVTAGVRFRELHVFSGESSSLVPAGPVPRQPRDVTWVNFWEGLSARAPTMLTACASVGRRRLALAACACARMALRTMETNDALERAVDAAEAWAYGEATEADVVGAAEVARDFLRQVSGTQVEVGEFLEVGAAEAAAHASAIPAATTARVALFRATDAVTSADDVALRRLEGVVRHFIPLTVAVCAAKGLRDPLPIPRRIRDGGAR